MDAAQLGKIPLFTGLSLDQRESVADACRRLEFDTGATLLQEGDFGYSMFAIAKGTADVVKDGQVVRSLGPGDVFGEIAVLSSGRRTATVVATSPIELVTILNRDVWRMERDHPEIASALRRQISDEVGSAAQ